MTRSDARAAGLRHYDNGNPCPRHHDPVKRLVSSGACVACGREMAREYYKRDPERIRANSLRYSRQNPDKIRERDANRDPTKRLPWAKEYRAANLGAIRVRIAEWQRANPEKRRANEATRRAKKIAAEGSYTPEDIERLKETQKGKCVYCRVFLKRFHVDHIMPLSKGGSNWPINLQLTCGSCNSQKGATHPVVFAQRIGLLI